LTAAAVKTVRESLVALESADGRIGGTGIIVSKDGVILTDKSVVASLPEYRAVFADGTNLAVAIIQSQNEGDLVFLAPTLNSKKIFTAAAIGLPDLGQTAFALAGTSSPLMSQGIVTATVSTTSGTIGGGIQTTISNSKVSPGSPLFDVQGNVLGISVSSLENGDTATFFPLVLLQDIIPKVR
jgi:S1-C subfamily serine protease